MLSLVTLDDLNGTPVTLHQDAAAGKRWLTQAHGLRGAQGLRINHRVRSQAHGGINETRFEDGRQITLVGEIMSQVSIEDALNEFALVAAPIIQTLDYGPALLKWTEGMTGNQLQCLVKLDGDLDPPFQEGQAILSYQAQFFAEDPRAYAQALQTVSSTPVTASGGGHTFNSEYPRTYASSGGGTVSFTNAGNRPTPVIYRIYGACVNPTIVLVGTGLKLVFNGSLTDVTQYLEVDSSKRTVKIVSTGSLGVNRLNFYDGANSSWFDLPAGVSNLQLIAASADANCRLDVIGRSAFA